MVHLELVVAKLVVLAMGLLIAYQAFRGYRVHGSEPMLYVAVGFATISVGAIVEGLLFDVLGMSIFLAGTIQTSIVAVGMAFVLYSLYGIDDVPDDPPTGEDHPGDRRDVDGGE